MVPLRLVARHIPHHGSSQTQIEQPHIGDQGNDERPHAIGNISQVVYHERGEKEGHAGRESKGEPIHRYSACDSFVPAHNPPALSPKLAVPKLKSDCKFNPSLSTMEKTTPTHHKILTGFSVGAKTSNFLNSSAREEDCASTPPRMDAFSSLPVSLLCRK